MQYARRKQKFVKIFKVIILIPMFDFWCLLCFEYAEKVGAGYISGKAYSDLDRLLVLQI